MSKMHQAGVLLAAVFAAAVYAAVELGNLDDVVDCTVYISCSGKGEKYGLTREKYLECLEILDPVQENSDVEYFREKYGDYSIDNYEDLQEASCERLPESAQDLREYYEMDLANPDQGSQEKQERTDEFRRCLNDLVDKCKALKSNGTIDVPHY